VPLPVGVVVRLADTELVPVAVVDTELVCEGLAPREGVKLRLPVEVCVAVTEAEGDGVPVPVLLPVLLPVSLLLGLSLPLGLAVDDRLAVELAVPAGGGTQHMQQGIEQSRNSVGGARRRLVAAFNQALRLPGDAGRAQRYSLEPVLLTELLCDAVAAMDAVTLRLAVTEPLAVSDADGEGVLVPELLPEALLLSLELGVLVSVDAGEVEVLAEGEAVPAGQAEMQTQVADVNVTTRRGECAKQRCIWAAPAVQTALSRGVATGVASAPAHRWPSLTRSCSGWRSQPWCRCAWRTLTGCRWR